LRGIELFETSVTFFSGYGRNGVLANFDRKVEKEGVGFKYSSLFPIIMGGLTPEHHGFLNGLVNPYYTHIRIYRDVLKSGNRTAIQREEAWLAQNYPLTSKRS